MTKDEFEQRYANGSGIPLARLKELGFEAQPCDCEEGTCQGWKAMFTDPGRGRQVIPDNTMYFVPPKSSPEVQRLMFDKKGTAVRTYAAALIILAIKRPKLFGKLTGLSTDKE